MKIKKRKGGKKKNIKERKIDWEAYKRERLVFMEKRRVN